MTETSPTPAKGASDAGLAADAAADADAGRARRIERARERDVDRLVFFSDAVIAIAITLLALEIRPDLPLNLSDEQIRSELPGKVRELIPLIVTFAWSAVVLASYWSLHRRMFAQVVRLDGMLVFLNTVFLILIALLPFPSYMLGAYITIPLTDIAYALNVAAISLVVMLMWLRAYAGNRLTDTDLDRSEVRRTVIVYLWPVIVFLASIPVAIVAPDYGPATWSLLILIGPLRRWAASERRPLEGPA